MTEESLQSTENGGPNGTAAQFGDGASDAVRAILLDRDDQADQIIDDNVQFVENVESNRERVQTGQDSASTVEAFLLEAVAKQKAQSEATVQEAIAKVKAEAEAAALEQKAALQAKIEEALTRRHEAERDIERQEAELAEVKSEIAACKKVEKEQREYRGQLEQRIEEPRAELAAVEARLAEEISNRQSVEKELAQCRKPMVEIVPTSAVEPSRPNEDLVKALAEQAMKLAEETAVEIARVRANGEEQIRAYSQTLVKVKRDAQKQATVYSAALVRVKAGVDDRAWAIPLVTAAIYAPQVMVKHTRAIPAEPRHCTGDTSRETLGIIAVLILATIATGLILMLN